MTSATKHPRPPLFCRKYKRQVGLQRTLSPLMPQFADIQALSKRVDYLSNLHLPSPRTQPFRAMSPLSSKFRSAIYLSSLPSRKLLETIRRVPRAKLLVRSGVGSRTISTLCWRASVHSDSISSRCTCAPSGLASLATIEKLYMLLPSQA